MARVRRLNQAFVVYCGLPILVLLIYLQSIHFSFVNYDDGSYVFQNPNISSGLRWHGILWAFTHVHSQNWHPLTSISHMLDCQFFGLQAGAHHLVNVVLHALAAVLLFRFLLRSTDAFWPSAIAAALFAAHPLRVESVAWISERKDVLSGVFFMLTLLAYSRYVEEPKQRRMSLVVLTFACGLLAKPMLVTTPFILLLLDCWPFHRRQTPGRRFLEKLPLLGLSIASCVATLLAQRLAVGTTQNLPVMLRINNALTSYVIYLRQMVWPTDLIPFYLHPEARVAYWQPIAAIAFLAAVTATVFLLRRSKPYLLVGWLWYIVMLIPVIGIVQVGLQGHADRYTYLPGIGIIVALVWAMRDLFAPWTIRSFVVAPVSLAVLAILTALSYRQAGHWHDTESLWSYTLSISPNNDVAHTGLAGIQFVRDETEEAISHYRRAIALRDGNAAAHHGLALALARQRKMDEAISHWEQSLEIRPDDTEARNYLGSALASVGREEEAIAQWQETLTWDAENRDAMNNLAWIFATSSSSGVRNGARAVQFAKRAVGAGGENALALRTLAVAYAENRQFPDAIHAAEQAMHLAQSSGNGALAGELQRYVELFSEGKSLRER